MNTLIETQETKDFNRFKAFLNNNDRIINLQRTTDKFCRWDATYTNILSGDWLVELKNRNFASDHKFATEGLILEEDKLQSILKECREKNKKAIYVNLMADGKIIVFVLNDELIKNTQVIEKYMNKCTFGGNTKIMKKVRLLKPEMGKVYEG